MRLSFENYMQSKNSAQGVTVVGGYWVGEDNSVYSEAKELKDVVTTPKTPILFDQNDINFLYQFPPGFWAAALCERYGNLLLKAKSMKDTGQSIPEVSDITLRDVASKGGARVGSFKNIKLYINELLEKLEKPRDLARLRELGYEDKDTYEGGVHGFNLGGSVQHGVTGETFTENYIPMTMTTARDVVNKWRNFLAEGWLGLPPNTTYKPINFGGGKPRKNKWFVDGTGKLREYKGSEVWMPVVSPSQLKAHHGARVDPKTGNVVIDYMLNGKPRQFNKRMPMLMPGKIIPTEKINTYNAHKAKLNTLLSKGADPNSEEVQNLVKTSSDIISKTKTYDEKDHAIHHFNKSTDRFGNRLYSNLYNDIKTSGGFHPLKNQKEQIRGTEEDFQTLKKHFITNRDIKNPRILYLDKSGKLNLLARSAVHEGLESFMNGIEGTAEWHVMNMVYDNIVKEAVKHIRGLAGEPTWAALAQALRTDPTRRDLPNLYRKVYREIHTASRNFAQEIWQLDLGRGSRRKRMSFETMYAANTLGRQRGETAEARAKGIPGDTSYFSKDLKGIRQRILEGLANKIKQKQDELDRLGEDDTKEFKMDLADQLRHIFLIFEQTMQDYIAEQLAGGNKKWSMDDAYHYASAKTKETLSNKGIAVSNGVPEKPLNKKKMLNQKDTKNQLLASHNPKLDKFLDQFGGIEELIEHPEKLTAALTAAQKFKGKEKVELMSVLSGIQKKAEAYRGTQAPVMQQPLPEEDHRQKILSHAGLLQSIIRDPYLYEKAFAVKDRFPVFDELLKKADVLIPKDANLIQLAKTNGNVLRKIRSMSGSFPVYAKLLRKVGM